MIRMLEPGLMTTVQDRGRWGHQDLGVPVAGPMDEFSHRLANRLVGNSFELATLEVTLVGPSLEFLAETTCVVVGARFELSLDGVQVQTGRAFRVPRGGGLRFGRRHAGARAYLAVAGGIDVAPIWRVGWEDSVDVRSELAIDWWWGPRLVDRRFVVW